MTKGHVQLGALGTSLREYIIDPSRWRKSQANPWTTKLNTGGDKYDDLEPFSFHVEQDWQAGVGRKGEDDGGFLFSTAETRVPGQVMLPQNVRYTDLYEEVGDAADDMRNVGTRAATGTMSFASTGSSRGFAIKFANGEAANANEIYLYCSLSDDFIGSLSFRATSPTGTAYASGSHTNTQTTSPYYSWQKFTCAITGTPGGASYFVLTVTAGTISFPGCTATGDEVLQVYNGSTWGTSGSYLTPFFVVYPRASTITTNKVKAITRFNGTLYAVSAVGSSDDVYKYVSADNNWSDVADIPQSATSAVVFNDVLYIGQSSGNFRTCNTSDTVSDGGSTGVFFAKWNGYLYKATTTTLSYSTDGSTWSGPFTVCKSPELITGLVGAQDTVWITTTDAIYYLAPGNVIRGVTRWGSSRSTNGASPVNWQGTIYCIADGGVAQVNVAAGSATVLPVWANRDDDLVAEFLETPVSLVVSNNWLVAFVPHNSTDPLYTLGSVWAYNGQGWHSLGVMPSHGHCCLYYDFNTSKIWIGGTFSIVSLRFPDYTISPLNDTNAVFAPSAWLETPWLNGGLVDTNKDFESVYIKGSELASGQTVTVFWQERGEDWQELGTVDADGEELRWSTAATRPAAKEIKLGFRLFSTSLTASPNIEAIRLKFRHNVEDRWAWTLIMPIHANQQMLDDAVNPYTRDQVVAHLEALVKSTPPFTYTDIDGTSYTVICSGYELNAVDFEYYNSANQHKYMAAVSLEQYIV